MALPPLHVAVQNTVPDIAVLAAPMRDQMAVVSALEQMVHVFQAHPGSRVVKVLGYPRVGEEPAPSQCVHDALGVATIVLKGQADDPDVEELCLHLHIVEADDPGRRQETYDQVMHTGFLAAAGMQLARCVSGKMCSTILATVLDSAPFASGDGALEALLLHNGWQPTPHLSMFSVDVHSPYLRHSAVKRGLQFEIPNDLSPAELEEEPEFRRSRHINEALKHNSYLNKSSSLPFNPLYGVAEFAVPAEAACLVNKYLLHPSHHKYMNMQTSDGLQDVPVLIVGKHNLQGFGRYGSIHAPLDAKAQEERTAVARTKTEIRALIDIIPGFQQVYVRCLTALGLPVKTKGKDGKGVALHEAFVQAHFFLADATSQANFSWHTDNYDLGVHPQRFITAVVQLGEEERTACQVWQPAQCVPAGDGSHATHNWLSALAPGVGLQAFHLLWTRRSRPHAWGWHPQELTLEVCA